jgi:hypothetical protein
MTMGFAIASLRPDAPREVLVAADSRLSFSTGNHSDTGIKTLEVGGRVVIVAAGHAIPATASAEMTRPIVERHNRELPTRRIGFYDTCRILAFFIKRAAEPHGWSCHVVAAGFLSSGTPALANIVVSPSRNRVSFFQPDPGGVLSIPVGIDDGKRLLLKGLAKATQEGRRVVESGVGLLWYMNRHADPAFMSVGGGLSIGMCGAEESSPSWPIFEIDQHRFYRGLEVSAYARPSWPQPIRFEYDKSWCEILDHEVSKNCEPFGDFTEIRGGAYEIDALVTPDTLFATCDDPEAFDNGLARPR